VRLVATASILVCLGLLGCQSKGGGTGASVPSAFNLKPDAKIPLKASLKIGEIDMPVEIKQTQTGDQIRIDLEAHGQVLESEAYLAKEGAFELAAVAGENYKDPLPLLKFPMNVGDTWNWVGTMTAGDEPHKASATISTSSDKVLLPASGSQEAVLVVVDLEIESGGPEPAKRKLRFWFVKDKGLVKRQFGTASSRDPVE
jgi:hypothetical protein